MVVVMVMVGVSKGVGWWGGGGLTLRINAKTLCDAAVSGN